MKKTIFYSTLIAQFVTTTLQAKAQDACVDLFIRNSQAPLNTSDGQSSQNPFDPVLHTSRKWLSEQTARARNHFDQQTKETLVKNIEATILEDNQKPRDIFGPLETDSSTIKIVDQGLASHKPVEVLMIDKKTGQTEVLLSSLNMADLKLSKEEKEIYKNPSPTIKNYRNNNTVIPVWAQFSPLKDYLLVKVSSRGSIDGHTLAIIRMSDRKIIQEIENVSSSDMTWVSAGQFIFDYQTTGRKSFIASKNEMGQFVINEYTNARISASNDQQWIYAQKSRANTVITSVTKNILVEVPISNIESILKTTKNPDTLWILTNGQAGFKELSKVVINKTNTGEPKVEKTTIAAEEKAVIESADVQDNHVLISKYYGQDRWVEIKDLDGNPIQKLKVPENCSASPAEYNPETKELKVALVTPVKKATPWFYNFETKEWFVKTGENERTKADPRIDGMIVDGVKYITEYKVYKSKDGTEIPLRITYKEGTLMNGEAPTLMEGYGGFALNNYFFPAYEAMTFRFIKSGGVHLAPALRGSYFFGKTWHDQGRALKKQNVIDDFIGAAEWAIANKVTSAKKLAISGASHGGLLVGASITQRPDLFGLAFPQYGPHSFQDKPALDPITTPLQVSEYGDLINDPVAQENARKISPELRAIPQNYPMTVIITGRQDSRVNPIHSYRFAAKLMQNQKGDQPIYLYTNTNSGHWMTSVPRQDFIGWRSKVTFWSTIFDYMKMDFKK